MVNLTRWLSDRLASESSRRGFLGNLGKMVLVTGAVVTGLSTAVAEACGGGCGQPPCPACNPAACTFFQTDSFVGCCKFGTNWYATHYCSSTSNPSQNCYYTIAAQPNCPNIRSGATSALHPA